MSSSGSRGHTLKAATLVTTLAKGAPIQGYTKLIFAEALRIFAPADSLNRKQSQLQALLVGNTGK